MASIDPLDRRILFELDHNSRQSVTTLARKLRQGRDRIEYRIQKLVDQKIIAKYHAQIDLYKLGLIFFKTYLRLENNKLRIAEFLRYLMQHPRVYWFALCDGSWDLIVVILATGPKEFYEIHNSILSQFNEVVINFSTFTIVDFKIHPRTYLQKAARTPIAFGDTRERTEIDQLDYQILRLLAQDARIPSSQIAEITNSSPAVIGYRIEALEKRAIILSYQLGLNLKALNMVMFKAQFYLRSYDLKLRQQFSDYCSQNPNITYFIEQVGDCNIEIELEVSDYQEYAKIIEEIRSEFAKLIRNFSTMLIRSTWHAPMPIELPGLV